MSLLRSNSELRKDGIWNFTIPAWHTRIDGKFIKTCPNAGACAKLCYARNGTYLFPEVKKAHEESLRFILEDLEGFKAAIINELKSPKFRMTLKARGFPFEITDSFLKRWSRNGGAAVRIHDAGDFFSEDYLNAWLDIARARKNVLFYAYTKEVAMFKRLSSTFPDNFRFIFSTGGLQDHLIDFENDRHADVFPSKNSLVEAGYIDQSDNDLYAILLPTNRIGIVINNIATFKKALGDRRFSEVRPTR